MPGVKLARIRGEGGGHDELSTLDQVGGHHKIWKRMWGSSTLCCEHLSNLNLYSPLATPVL